MSLLRAWGGGVYRRGLKRRKNITIFPKRLYKKTNINKLKVIDQYKSIY